MNQMIQNPADLLAALDRGESLPAHWYTDPSITEQEIVQIFRKAWNYIGPLSELKNPGDYIAGYAAEVPVVVIRNETGLAGFVNVCRHRRHEVMKGRGNAKVMQCGYHAWTYDLSGCLKGAPRSATEPNFRLANYPLLPLRVETLGPFVLVDLDRDAAPVHAYFEPVLDIIAGSGINLDTLKLYRGEDWSGFPTGRRCSRTISSVTTAQWHILVSAPPSMSSRKTITSPCMAGSPVSWVRCASRHSKGKPLSKPMMLAAR